MSDLITLHGAGAAVARTGRVLSLALCVIALPVGVSAQRCPQAPALLNAGMPWTVVEDDELPECFPWAADSAQVAAIRQTHAEYGQTIRHIFRLYHHPELMPLNLRGKDTMSINVEVPREPGVSEVVTFRRSYPSVVRDQAPGIIGFHGLMPSGYGRGTIFYIFSDRSVPTTTGDPVKADSAYVAFLDAVPVSYRVWDGIPGYRRWGYFVQLVVPGIHPSAVSEVAQTPSPRVFPSPTRDRIEVSVPEGWDGSVAETTIYDPMGRQVLAREVRFGDEGASGVTLEVGHMPAGMYLLHLRRRGGSEWTQVQFVRE